ncbi:ribosome biogenesis GTP-binding protein YihA/YsxC [Salicibibacter kimchii]|uniref:Probable GTP-binding protein EngB n=1 Tax=Salicibibacter kimchii TaxID=2099786 RepID=A0A345BXX3_9BACI|nr:ribosome biogenesis GTP-binding protein YihA/YsxC [Salicibibacter kimchii]AXF55804.1 YihA family ribosome biogenesis GTP-binding protein [Salicibibacter kimchii]
MKVNKAELIISAVGPEQYPEAELPEIAFAGRSNVGKSSFINTITQRKKLAYTSQQPGKTRTLNFFTINDSCHFVDIPGYGYAKVSKKERAFWGRIIEEYIQTRSQLKGVVLLLDARHKPSEQDLMMYDWLKYYQIPIILVLTKMDKLKKSKRTAHVKQVIDEIEPLPEDKYVLFSSETGEGKEEAWSLIRALGGF